MEKFPISGMMKFLYERKTILKFLTYLMSLTLLKFLIKLFALCNTVILSLLIYLCIFVNK